MKKYMVLLVFLIVASFLLSACSSNSSTTNSTTATTAATTPATTNPVTSPNAQTTSTTTTTAPAATTTAPKYGGIFRYVDPRAPSTSLGWFAEAGAQGGMWSPPMLETLMECDINGKFTPFLATNWVVSDDLKTITFTLRKGVKFHDGSDFNATVAKWNFDQMMINKAAAAWSNISSVDLIDDYTIRLNLTKYQNTILNTLSATFMISKAAFDAKGKEWLRWNPVGTGPFKFVSFQRDVAIKYTKFADYWQPGKPYLDGVEMSFVADPVTMSAAFEAGDFDAMGGDLSSVHYDLQQKGFPIISCYAGTYTLIPDSKNTDSPWNKLGVRQALDYAIDRDALIKARGFGFWTKTFQYANPGTPFYNTNLGSRDYDPAKAKQLLADAGFPNGFKTSIYADVASSDKDAITAIQSYMGAVGIQANLQMLDFASYGNYRTKGWNNGVMAGMVGFFGNPNTGTDTYWAKTAPFFVSVDKSDDFQNLHLASLASKDVDPALVQKVNQYEYDNALFLPLWAGSRGDVVKPFVKDTGLYTMATWTGWKPYQTWLNK